MNKEIIKNILHFYLDKEKEIIGNYKYVNYERIIKYEFCNELTEFENACYENKILLKTKLNYTDSKTVFCLFVCLYEKKDLFSYLATIDDYLIPAILKKENVESLDGIDIYNIKYINEWVDYISVYCDDKLIKITQNNTIPGVMKYTFEKDVQQKIMTIQEIIELSG
jgi:hypothetical protein